MTVKSNEENSEIFGQLRPRIGPLDKVATVTDGKYGTPNPYQPNIILLIYIYL